MARVHGSGRCMWLAGLYRDFKTPLETQARGGRAAGQSGKTRGRQRNQARSRGVSMLHAVRCRFSRAWVLIAGWAQPRNQAARRQLRGGQQWPQVAQRASKAGGKATPGACCLL